MLEIVPPGGQYMQKTKLVFLFLTVGAQQLDGYGQECFLAKDERDSEVIIGASLNGIGKSTF